MGIGRKATTCLPRRCPSTNRTRKGRVRDARVDGARRGAKGRGGRGADDAHPIRTAGGRRDATALRITAPKSGGSWIPSRQRPGDRGLRGRPPRRRARARCPGGAPGAVPPFRSASISRRATLSTTNLLSRRSVRGVEATGCFPLARSTSTGGRSAHRGPAARDPACIPNTTPLGTLVRRPPRVPRRAAVGTGARRLSKVAMWGPVASVISAISAGRRARIEASRWVAHDQTLLPSAMACRCPNRSVLRWAAPRGEYPG